MASGLDRRDFLKLLGASAAAPVVSCASKPVETLIPYVVQPEEITPGVATYYATVCQECPAGCGLVVRTTEGRAVKVEGNPAHPINQRTPYAHADRRPCKDCIIRTVSASRCLVTRPES